MRAAPYVSPTLIDIQKREDGCLILTNPHPMRAAFENVCAPLFHHSKENPDHLWLCGKENGEWRKVSYAEGAKIIADIAAELEGILPRGSVVAIASGNSLMHAFLTYALPLIGLVPAPISPAYSLKANDSRRLKEAIEILGAKAIFFEGPEFARAIEWLEGYDILVLSALNPPSLAGEGDRAKHGGGGASPLMGFVPIGRWLASLAPHPPRVARSPLPASGEGFVARALTAISPQDLCKVLLTSGSTGSPKAVAITHFNLSQNAAQIRSTFDSEKEKEIWPDGIVMINHLPWSHSLGGNAILHMLTHSCGTLWIDEGSPTHEGIKKSVEAIKLVKPNYHNTVPFGWTLLLHELEHDEELAHALFENLIIMQYGGAAMSQDVFARLQAIAKRITGEEITLAAGYGATETGPTACNVHWPNSRMGLVGLPVPGVTMKLVPHNDKLEARVKGPAITPYYLNNETKTKEAFDDEGFYILGDSLAFYDPAHPEYGLKFDGRLSEEFKLLNGSFVQVSALRLGVIAACNGLVSDAVICGEGRAFLGALLFLNANNCNKIFGENSIEVHAKNPQLIKAIKDYLQPIYKGKSATLAIKTFTIIPNSPSLEAGEITDKGYLNQSRCRANYADLEDMIYDNKANNL